MLCVLCLIVLWGFSLVTSYSGVIAYTHPGGCTEFDVNHAWKNRGNLCKAGGTQVTHQLRCSVRPHLFVVTDTKKKAASMDDCADLCNTMLL